MDVLARCDFFDDRRADDHAGGQVIEDQQLGEFEHPFGQLWWRRHDEYGKDSEEQH